MTFPHYIIISALLGIGGLLYVATSPTSNAQQSHTPFKTTEEISQDIPVAFPADI